MIRHSGFGFLVFLCFICGSLSCDRAQSARRELVLYTSVDQPIAAPIVAEFEKQTGIRVLLVTDAEATKSVGLAERLRAEKSNPQADVFWGNEIFHTINLAEEGIFAPYESASAADIPAMFKDPQHCWAGNAVRVRVIVVSPLSSFMPQGLEDLARGGFGIAMARPTAGTTGGHVAAIYALWGNEKADAYFHQLHEKGIKLLGGNSAVAQQAQQGTIMMGLTDNDDVHAARQHGAPTMIVPDQNNSFGTLVIPCTVGLVQPSDDAKRLVDYLLSRQVESQLMEINFAYASVRDDTKVKPMQIDYRAVAKIMPDAVRRATDILEGRQ